MKSIIKKAIKKSFYFSVPNSVLLMSGDSLSPSVRNLYLTYDDGPNPDVTPSLLDLLDKYEAKATFFVIGELAEKHPDIIRDIIKRGHTIANHSYSHRKFSTLSTKERMEEINQTNSVLLNITGQQCKIFRPPQGTLSISMLIALALKGITTVNWSRDTNDCRESATEVIAGLKENPLKDGDIVLMHDDNKDAITITEDVFLKFHLKYKFKSL